MEYDNNTRTCYYYYFKFCSINKLQNGTVPLIPKIGKIQSSRYVGSLILNIHRNFFDDNVIIVTEHSLSVHYSLTLSVTGRLQRQRRHI